MYVRATLFAVSKWKEILIAAVVLFTAIFVMFFSAQEENTEFVGDGGTATVSPLVRRYEPLVRAAAEKYGVGGYVELLLAKMMQESGGRLPDVMQSSESIGLPPNTITDPAVSIDVGVKYFAQVLKKAGGDVPLALQSYNFGMGFIDWALDRGGYSKENAQAFSSMMAAKLHWTSYGDVNYVDNIMRYYNGGATPVNSFGFIRPLKGEITSPFAVRIHPIYGYAEMHEGVDIGCQRQTPPIAAAKSGTVTRAGWQDPGNHKVGYGQRVYIDHGGGVVTVYAHLSSISVREGQKVSQGQKIGNCGTTGSSTAEHLHLELHLSGRKVDPSPYIYN